VLVEPHDDESLYKGITDVLENGPFVEQLLEKGENRARENDQRYLIQKVLEVYSPPGG
jgi:hypothetical protein